MEPETKSNGAFVGLIVYYISLSRAEYICGKSNKDALEKNQNPAESQAITDQDASALDALELDAESIDTATGVDANAVN